jgi:hypothetical protein
MKCAGRHALHSQCPRGWIVNQKRSTCPYCRHDFSLAICDDILAALEHAVELSGTTSAVHWTKTPSQRVTALNMLALPPPDTHLGGAMASALLHSCFDSEVDISHVALQSGKLCFAIKVMNEDDINRWCLKLVDAMKHAQDDCRRSIVATAIGDVAESEEGCACFVRGGACGALFEALKAGEDENTICNVALAVRQLAKSEEVRACFVVLDAVRELKLLLSRHPNSNWKAMIISVLELFECFCSKNKRMKFGDAPANYDLQR